MPESHKPERAPRKTLRRLGLLAFIAFWACGSDSITFTPEEDTDIMAKLESFWADSGQTGMQLSLCEDLERSDAWNNPGDCQEAHVVRGGGRGIEHKEELTGIGCGGCPFTVLAYLQGTLSGVPFAEPVPVQGSVDFGDLYDVDGIFAYPYRLSLACIGDVPACYAVEGWLQKDGQLDLTVHLDSSLAADYEVTLTMQGAASCTASE